MTTQSKRLVIISLLVAMILLIPLVAMQFTNEVKWTLLDFIVAGILLLGTGFTFELVIRKIKKKQNRIVLFIIILGLLILIWLELAVGIFSSPIAGS